MSLCYLHCDHSSGAVKFPNVSVTAAKFLEISRSSRQLVTVYLVNYFAAFRLKTSKNTCKTGCWRWKEEKRHNRRGRTLWMKIWKRWDRTGKTRKSVAGNRTNSCHSLFKGTGRNKCNDVSSLTHTGQQPGYLHQPVHRPATLPWKSPQNYLFPGPRKYFNTEKGIKVLEFDVKKFCKYAKVFQAPWTGQCTIVYEITKTSTEAISDMKLQ